jgi:hypothetical protein
MPDGATKLLAALAIAGEGALALIGASLNKPVFLGDLAEPSTPYSGGVRLRRNPVTAMGRGEGPLTTLVAVHLAELNTTLHKCSLSAAVPAPEDSQRKP